MSRILPSITTLDIADSTWRTKIDEVQEFTLNEVALFLTGLNESGRHECLTTLKKACPNLVVPFVHAKSDMRVSEFDRLIEEFGTERFNLHPTRYLPTLEELPQRLKDKIYIENLNEGLLAEDLLGFAGICLDVSHLEDCRLLSPEFYEKVCQLLKEYPLGTNHMSAVADSTATYDGKVFCYSRHTMTKLSEYDYLKTYPLNYFSHFAAIELNNSIAEQLQVKKYIEKILEEKATQQV